MDFRQLKAIESANKKKLLKLFPNLTDESGIYVLYRFEDDFKFAYVGQAEKILTRLASHMRGYQHIDLSIKNHGWYSKENESGWRVATYKFSITELDEKEKYFIRECAKAGYQLRNKTAGGQGEGHKIIAETRPAKGYYDGLKQGEKKLKRQLNNIINRYLEISLKKDNKSSQKAFEKFKLLLTEEEIDVAN